MKIDLVRIEYRPASTIGKLLVDRILECYTLEDVVREVSDQPVEAWKIKGVTAIPRGTYNLVITPSNRFKRDLPLLLDVPGFTGVRIHKGNSPENTEGCILVGEYYNATTDWLNNSGKAFDPLFKKIKEALARGETVTFTVS